jgi:S-adenosylmethionine:tRNA ribosyltransferase-isomerase
MKASEFDYDLPQHLIAQQPLATRTASRLLVLDPAGQSIRDARFGELRQFLEPGDLLVFNNTQVFPARLFGRKESGGRVEVLVERILNPNEVLAHVRSSKSPRSGVSLTLEDTIDCTVVGRQEDLFHLQLTQQGDWLSLLQQHGHMPLPPYIERGDDAEDRSRYQTVYARHVGAVAAPTAGLHFDEKMIDALRADGVETAEVTLHVGAGTFQPLRVDDVSEHVMHAELAEVDARVCDQIKQTQQRGGRVVAVGTTVVRSLEAAAAGGELKPFSDETRLFITPGFKFNVVDAMLTNFHLPKSTLLMLVSAFAGQAFIREAYAHAVREEYRFFSYGDAMFIRNRIS